MSRVNYSKALDKEIQSLTERGLKPRLLLHSCCAPCSSYVLEYLREYFHITVFFYNPNITESGEYAYRLAEEKRLIAEYNRQVEEQDLTGMHSTAEAMKIGILEAPYDPDRFLTAVRGYEDCPEGGDRCLACFALRLRETARQAKAHGFEYFTTTLSVSPHKNADNVNRFGEAAGRQAGVKYLFADFKKKNGYLRSLQVSKEYDLYRQHYCGCLYSKLL